MANKKLPVLICGGGIGGLAMANCLQRVGIPFKVLEATPEFGVAGYGIGLGYNAMRCLEKINPDLGQRIAAIGVPSTSSFATAKGENVLKLDTKGTYAKYSPSQFLPMSRHNLQKELLHDLSSDNLILGKRVTSFENQEHGVTVQMEDGSSIEGSMLIGADGIKSTIRKKLHEKYSDELGPDPKVIYTNFTLLGGESEFKLEKEPEEISDFTWIFGGGKLGTILPIKPVRGSKTIFWSVGVDSEIPIGKPVIDHDQQRGVILELAKSFEKKFGFYEFINKAKKFVIWDIYELDREKNTKAWGYGNVTLLGDAAHAVTPWVGQGAGISIEDAFDLTHRLLEFPDDVPRAIKEYEKIRIPRANMIRSVAAFNFKFFKLFQYPVAIPFLKYYYKLITIPAIFDVISNPIVGYDLPKESLPAKSKK